MWIRYNATSRDEIYRSTVPFTIPPGAGQADVSIPDSAVTLPFGACRMTADLTGLETDPARVPAPLPNWTGFIQWIAATFDAPTKNALGNAYSLFYSAIQQGMASDVAWCLTDAKAKAIITSAQYAQFQTANTTYSLGMGLP